MQLSVKKWTSFAEAFNWMWRACRQSGIEGRLSSTLLTDSSLTSFRSTCLKGGSTVHFTFVDEGLHSTSGFERYLVQYEPLLRELPTSRIVYVAAFPDQMSSAKRVFERFRNRPTDTRPLDPHVRRLIAYFRDRSAYERRDFAEFTQAKLIQFREDRDAFTGIEYDRMFEDWKRAGDEVVFARFGTHPSSVARSVFTEFCTHLLPFDYKLFGTLGDGNWQGRPA